MSVFTATPKKNGQDSTRTGSENMLSIIAQGNTLEGNVYSDGDIRIEGRVLGKLVCRSKLVIGANGYVKGNIDAANATIAGQVDGTIMVREVLQVQETGRIYGDIITEKLIMNAGGVFTGSCKMGKEAREVLSSAPQPTAPLPEKVGAATPRQPLPSNLNKISA